MGSHFVENRGGGGVKAVKEELADGDEDGKMFMKGDGVGKIDDAADKV